MRICLRTPCARARRRKGLGLAGCSVPGEGLNPVLTFSVQTTDSDKHALLQRICGLSSPRSHQKTHRRRVHRGPQSTGGARACPGCPAGGVDARRSHQRRGAHHSGDLLRRDAAERRQLPGDVQEDQERTGAQVQGRAMRISREKINKLAHAVADTLAETDSVDFIEDRNTIRQEARRILEGLMAEEAKIDAAARQKIESQRRTILEGSQEWDILYRKYYNEEVKKLGI